MPSEAVDTGLSDQELFDQANADEAPADEAVVEAPEAEQEAQPHRDEQGRFASKEEEQPAVAAEAEKPTVDDNTPLVPSWRLREINEEKRSLAEKLANLEAERAQWQRTQVKKEEPEKAARPDPLLDPDGYAKQVREDIRQELLNERREESLQTAAEKYGDEFKEAYQAAQQRIDPALRARMQESRNPGETLMKWHREQKTMSEIGSDLTAYKQRLRDEALKDPEFRKAAMEAWQNEAQPGKNGRPRVELPPTLNGASRANAALRSDSGDVSDSDLFREIAG